MRVVIGRSLGAAVVALGCVTLVGWAIESRALTEVFEGQDASLKANTAICLVLLGLAVVLRETPHQRPRTILEVTAGVIAFATAFEYLRDLPFGIDELVFDDPFTTAEPAGRMSLGSSFALTLAAVGLLGLDSLQHRIRVAAHAPLLLAGAIGFVALVGYGSGLDELYWHTEFTAMAIQSAVGIVVLVSGALVLAPVEGVIAALLRPTSGGRLLRRMVPAAVLVPAAFVIPIGRGANEGYYGFDVGMLLFLIATVSVSLPVLFWTARSLDASEAHAKAESERFSSVLRAATEHSIVGTDVDGLITVFNEGAERLLGYSAKEVVGREMTVLHDPAEVAARAAELGVEPGFRVLVASAKRNRAETREWTYVRQDGGRVPVALTVTATRREDGTQSGYMGMGFDLSARKELEREVQRQAEFTGTLVASAPVGIYATDADGRCVFVNDKWQELSGLTRDDALGDGWGEAIHPDDAGYVANAWSAFALGGVQFAVEFRFLRRDESVAWVASRAVALHAEDGAVSGYLGTIVDVTERHAAEAQRERLLAQSQAVLDATTDGILMTDVHGEVLFSNTAMHAFWKDVGLVGEGSIWDRIASLAERITSPAEYHRLLQSVALDPEGEHIGEFTVVDTGRSFVGRTAPVPASDGSLMGRIFSLRETTTEQAAARAKEEFVATVSHELRTPLAAIKGYAELLEDDVSSLGEETVQFLSVVQRNAERLTRLVDDLLLLQRSETEGVELEWTSVELDEIVRHSIERVEPAATRKSIAIGLEASGAHVVPGDAMRLGQVLDNLLSNAVKFTPDHGSVTVRLERANGVCTVEVEDTGHGIPKDERGRVFERFFRSRDAVARSIPGTGLGLVVSRRIAEAHGGGLELVEGNGNGTTFRLLLPVGSPAAEAQVASAQRR